MMQYTELQVTTNFSFLRGASHPEEMVSEAKQLGHEAIAITDRNTLAGVVRAHKEAKKVGLRMITGCRLDLADGIHLLVLPTRLTGYTALSNLLTLGNRRTEKGKCDLYKEDMLGTIRDAVVIAIPPDKLEADTKIPQNFLNDLLQYKEAFGNKLYLAATRAYNGQDLKLMHRLWEIEKNYGIPMVATNDVYYHHSSRRELQDIMTCVREKCTIHTAGYKLLSNRERFLKPVSEMIRLFRQYPQAVERTMEINETCQFALTELSYRYPKEILEPGFSPQETITKLAWEGASAIYDPIPEKVKENIRYELKFIEEMNYAEYFLTVYDIVRYARSQGILCQGRGSAANSTICYCLGITSVDPSKFDLLFERFISSARNEPPDIDVDFEHERREEVIQYIYNKYGRERAGIVATVTQLHHKGAIRDVGKAMGLSEDVIRNLSGLIWDFDEDGFDPKRIAAQGINPEDKTIRKVLELTTQYMGFPRQLGQHTGGFVITEGRLSDLCPILNARMKDRTCIEWNKDDIEALGFLKMDVLALGMLTCIRKAFDLAKQHYDLNLTLANIPQDDPAVYEMVGHADTIGVFQIESRAQQAMLPRLKPTCFYDLVIEVAIVRPGPIQGDMVHPYLRRRNREEPVEYPSKELEEILGRTLGVPLFQEQAMKIAIVAAGFTPTEADELRRSMATFKAKGLVSAFEKKLIAGMTGNGYTLEYAQRVFRQLEGFGSYGFPESHAVSFALLVYVSSWIKCYYPDVFACALLNSMPMGFYQPAQIIGDAKNHEVKIAQVDVNHSYWDNCLEDHAEKYRTLRLGFREVKGLRMDDLITLIENRHTPFTSITQIREVGVPQSTLERLADADAFRSLGYDRRQALWEVARKDYVSHNLFNMGASKGESRLPGMTIGEHVVQDYGATGFSLKAHPLQLIRESLQQLRVITIASMKDLPHGARVKVSGLVLIRQRPGTAKGVCFITIEDETGNANLVLFKDLFDKFRKEVIQSKLLMVEGQLQREGEVMHVIVKKCHNYSRLLRKLTQQKDTSLTVPLLRADETTSPFLSVPEGKVFPEGRNFR